MGIEVWKPYHEKNLTDRMGLGDFLLQCFPLPHNGTSNFGFYINANGHKILYLTDFEYCRFSFKSLAVNHILCECNYQKDFVDRDLPNFEHKVKGHCSLDTCKGFVKANVTDSLRTVLLLHMGRDTLDCDYAVSEIQKVAPQAYVDYARAGESYELKGDECPF